LRIGNLVLYQEKRLRLSVSPGNSAKPWIRAATEQERMCDLIEDQINWIDSIATKEGDKFGRASELKEEIEKLQRLLVKSTDLRDGLNDIAETVRTWSSKQKHRNIYYRNVLLSWWAAGGTLGRSRPKDESEMREPTGPAIDYFNAVVEPVLKSNALGKERIYQIIPEVRDSIPEDYDLVWRKLVTEESPDKLWSDLLFGGVGKKRRPW
jgi:hypothetical protein